MIHHPLILGPKLVVLVVIIVALVILHGYLTPGQFTIAMIVAATVFVCFSAALWTIALRLLRNPDSKMAKQMVLSDQARAEHGFLPSTDEFTALIGNRGIALSALRPSGIASFAERRVPVITEGAFIPSGSPVEIVAARGSKVIVRPVPDSADIEQRQ